MDAYIATSDSHAPDRALKEPKPDVIPLNETKSFLDQVTTLHDKIDDARWVFESGASNEAERAKARKDVVKHWNDMHLDDLFRYNDHDYEAVTQSGHS